MASLAVEQVASVHHQPHREGATLSAVRGGMDSSSGRSCNSKQVQNEAAEYARRYSKHELIGQGAQKKVYKAFDEDDGIEVAWNEVPVGEMAWTTDKERAKLFAEVRVLNQLRHKNIMTLKHWWFDPSSRCICFITELFTDGTLRQYRHKHKNVDSIVLKRWAWQILQGLVYLHGHNPPIIHRDLKSDNIFVNGSSGVVKIGDLGFATMRAGLSTVMSVIGTPEFMAPELYEESYNEKVDVYSFGLCLLELATLEYPYSECRNAAQIFKKVTKGIAPAGLEKIKDEELHAFISLCIVHDPELRPEARQLLKHPFFDRVRSNGGAKPTSPGAPNPRASSPGSPIISSPPPTISCPLPTVPNCLATPIPTTNGNGLSVTVVGPPGGAACPPLSLEVVLGDATAIVTSVPTAFLPPCTPPPTPIPPTSPALASYINQAFQPIPIPPSSSLPPTLADFDRALQLSPLMHGSYPLHAHQHTQPGLLSPPNAFPSTISQASLSSALPLASPPFSPDLLSPDYHLQSAHTEPSLAPSLVLSNGDINPNLRSISFLVSQTQANNHAHDSGELQMNEMMFDQPDGGSPTVLRTQSSRLLSVFSEPNDLPVISEDRANNIVVVGQTEAHVLPIICEDGANSIGVVGQTGGRVSDGIDISMGQRLRLDCKPDGEEQGLLNFSMSFVNNGGTRKRVGFLYDLGEDEPQIIAHEMVENLSLNVSEAGFIANMIQREISRFGKNLDEDGLPTQMRSAVLLTQPSLEAKPILNAPIQEAALEAAPMRADAAPSPQSPTWDDGELHREQSTGPACFF
eukprot:gene4846-34604_t